MVRDLFQDKTIQQTFEKNGYVKLPLLNPNEVRHLFDYYYNQEFDNKIEAGFHISLDSQNQSLVIEVGEEIKRILAPRSEDLLDESQIFTASYVIKEPGLKNIVPPHQDWTFVDETKYCSATFWVPLVDVNEENGALGVIKGSHKLFNHYRSSPSPQSKSPLADHVFTLFPYIDVIEMKAGEVLVFDNRLIHASPPNLSDQPRIAVGIGVTQKEAPLIHYYQTPEIEPAQLEAFEITKDFFTSFNNKNLSDLFDAGESLSGIKKIKSIPREIPELSNTQMEEMIKNLEGVSYNEPLMEKLAKLFSYNLDGNKIDYNVKPNINKGNMNSEEEKIEEHKEQQEPYKDTRTFFQKYTLSNILKELQWRLKGRP